MTKSRDCSTSKFRSDNVLTLCTHFRPGIEMDAVPIHIKLLWLSFLIFTEMNKILAIILSRDR